MHARDSIFVRIIVLINYNLPYKHLLETNLNSTKCTSIQSRQQREREETRPKKKKGKKRKGDRYRCPLLYNPNSSSSSLLNLNLTSCMARKKKVHFFWKKLVSILWHVRNFGHWFLYPLLCEWQIYHASLQIFIVGRQVKMTMSTHCHENHFLFSGFFTV